MVKTPPRCASGGHRAVARDSGAKPRALPVGKEERLVLADRTADRQPILIPAELRLRARLREIVAGVQILIAEEFEQRAVELVAAGLPDHHHGAAVRSAVLRRVGVDVELELLHRVDDRIERDLAGFRLQDADAVVQVLVGARAAAVDARQQRSAARKRDTRR